MRQLFWQEDLWPSEGAGFAIGALFSSKTALGNLICLMCRNKKKILAHSPIRIPHFPFPLVHFPFSILHSPFSIPPIPNFF